ncbi:MULTISPECIES: aminodeoxychorismate synthase component I [Nocardia]|uniref:aminodeoxychorismate synthase component I n=1 Tax=Nocardia TaxID=1817 RepID=UPI000BF12151|nr:MULTISPECIES: aminodeoxychorismate synthase component I [Nocardia]MBF6186419.1 aminodeoxychorismate synthase component I [Nocardia farcinica]MBF6313887.1 aminodeoxychorismate synthase component I [Nocardia farcinica]MBF6409321.1 aminodeoxychorismate synthase component I [Nocardia farcinica]PEH79619.1 aminodeoxychorismate synthase, component I [Nocardia sp. FDAARGOS_372]UEX24271.1 aminodeoxychorismate synthase component I [Nocardia farcinica]
MRTLLIDNYDSFTYNLYQLISEVNGVEPTVVRNDETDPAALDLAAYDNIVVSPGPGRPDRTRDVGLSAAVIDAASQPLLGVCLGHQGIVVAAGGRVDRAPVPRHGFLDRVGHDGRDLFAGLPQDFTVVRYHSLCALEPLPPALEVTARTPDGVIMGVRHRQRPQWGVQFHPESVAGEFGAALLRNFAELTLAHGKPARRTRPATPVTPARPAATDRPRWRLRHEVIERAVDTEAAFLRLYGASPTAFWLDSEHVEPGLDRFSFLGDASGPLAEVVRYRVGEDVVRVEDAAGTRTVAGDVLGYLSTQLRERHIELPALPFDFVGGYVGYLGYEVKADCGARAAHRAATPDAQWIFADRLIVVDHVAGQTHLVALTDDDTAADQWLRETGRVLETLPAWANPAELAIESAPASVAPLLNRGRDRYLADIAACLEYLRAGESYEICLTDSLTVDAAIGGLDFYRTLRRCNPAPYAAYLRFDDLEIACSSPERFLKIDRARTVESKPIKGTAPRGATPAEDERLRRELADSPKTRAENLMIVDLLRNDLGRVCQIGSVHVPELMATESYSTVHQLVSTVRGTLRPDVDAIDCVRACFPGGSMTGAPKLRTMEIIDELEGAPRGVYSGTIGFLGLGGTADLNIVIRTAVRHDGRWQIGAGGAIVLDSDPAEEYREMLWKAAATQRAATAAAATSR